jgi:hypothetical protein
MINFQERANDIWSIANLLRGYYKQLDYGIGKVAVVEGNLALNPNQAVFFIRLLEIFRSKYLWYWLQSNYISQMI